MKKFILLVLFCLFPLLAQAADETTYERVLRTKTIRCGYIPYVPAVSIDPNTNTFSGIVPDVMEEAARLLDLKVEWAEEVGWGTTVDALRTGRVDAICVGFWENPAEAKYMSFSTPLWYSAVSAYVRKDDSRFDKKAKDVFDDAKLTVATRDGEMSGIIARQDFPKAQVLSLPNMTSDTEQMMAVATKKADVTFVETFTAENFIANNPGSLKNVSDGKPLRVFANTIGLPMGDVRLQSMLNAALRQIINSGQMDKIIQKYERYPGSLLRVANPYEVAQ